MTKVMVLCFVAALLSSTVMFHSLTELIKAFLLASVIVLLS